MKPRALFVAGATGVVGRALIEAADLKSIAVTPHARPNPSRSDAIDPRSAVFDLSDEPRLVDTLAHCTTVVQLVGTRRAKIARGDTYDSSDVETTRRLADAAVKSGIDHFVLLSSVGAGSPKGAYLAAKARAETIVRESGVAYTIARPSFFVGGGHKAPPGAATLTRLFGLRRYQPIDIRDLAAALLHLAATRAELGSILEGQSLFDAVSRARTSAGTT